MDLLSFIIGVFVGEFALLLIIILCYVGGKDKNDTM